MPTSPMSALTVHTRPALSVAFQRKVRRSIRAALLPWLWAATAAGSNQTAPGSPAWLDRTYRIAEVGALSKQERALYMRFRPPFQGRLEFRDGIILRKGRPYFLVGSQIGAGQWNQKLMFLPRIMGDNYVTVSASPNRHLYLRFDDSRLVIAWERVPFVRSMVNEAARNGFFVYMDLGGGKAENMAGIVTNLRRRGLNGAQDWLDQCNTYYGHFYPVDACCELGRRFYRNGFASYLRYLVDPRLPIIAAELRNELGVYSFSPQALAGFRSYLQRKYGDIRTFNRVCRIEFVDFEAVVPPFLLDAEFAQRARSEPFRMVWRLWVQTVAEARSRYPELANDWVEFVRSYFVSGFHRIATEARSTYGEQFPITLQERMERVPTDTYQTVDIERIVSDLDFFGQQISNVLFYHYDGKPASPETVLEAMNRLTLYPDFGRGICTKPIVNTESIVEGSFPAERNLDHMRKSSIVNLETQWRTRFDPRNEGEKAGWQRPDFDDSTWKTTRLPGLSSCGKGRTWRRLTFHLDARYQRLRDFDFKRFVLYAGGLIPSGRIFLNGKLVFSGGGRTQDVIVDVSDFLEYGGTNTLAVAVDAPAGWGGVRGPLLLLDADDLRVKRSIDSGQTAALLWQHAVHGLSGVNFWRVKQPAVNPEIIRTRLAIESVAEVLLPPPRIRGQVAVLYPFESFGGLVRRLDDLPEFAEFMNVYGGLIFHQLPVDVISCRGVLAGRARRYRLLAVPMARMVRKGVFEEIVTFVENGGVLLLTHDSLLRDDAFYEPLPLERLIGAEAARASRTGAKSGYSLVRQIGRGRVIYLGAADDFRRTFESLKNVADLAGIRREAWIEFEPAGEFPFVEVQIIRRAPRFLVYVMNWGGKEQHGRLHVSASFLGGANRTWRVRDVRRARPLVPERFPTSALAAPGMRIRIPPQDPLVLLFEEESLDPLPLRQPAPGRMKVIRRLAELRKPRKRRPGRPCILFPKVHADMHLEHGKAGCPIVADLLEQAGCDVIEAYVSELSADDLRTIDLVFIQEDYQGSWRRMQQVRPELWNMLRDYMKNGGSMFVAGTIHAGWNAASFALNALLGPLGVTVPRRYPRDRAVWIEDPLHSPDGDPLHIVTDAVQKHPVTRGVRRVDLFCAAPIIDKHKLLAPLVLATADDRHFSSQPVIACGEYGKGRLLVSGEPYFLQPFHIERAYNLLLTWNALRWLLHDRIPALNAEQLQARLLFREAGVRRWERIEQTPPGKK